MKDTFIRKFLHLRPASYRTLSTNFFYISIYRALSICVGICITYFLTRSLSKHDFGNYQFILSVIGVCWMFTLPGMQNAIMQDMSREHGRSYRTANEITLLFSILGSMTLLGCALFYGLADEPLLHQGFILAAFAFPFFKGLQHWRGVKLGREEISKLYLNEGLTSLISGSLMVAALQLFPGSLLIPLSVALIIPSLQNILMTLKERARLPSENYNHEFIKYGYNTSFHLAAGILAQNLDKILVFVFLSPATLAIYVAANRFAEITRDSMQDIITIITPRLARMETYTLKLNDIFRYTSIAYGALLIVFSFTLLPWLISTIFGEQYHDAIPYAQALMLANCLGTFPTLQYRYIRSQLDTQGHKTSLYFALAQIGFSAALIPTLGLYGVVIAAFCNKITLIFFVRRIMKQRPAL